MTPAAPPINDNVFGSLGGAATTSCSNASSLGHTKSVMPNTDVSYHGIVTYTVALKNSGPVSDSLVTLTDMLPSTVGFRRYRRSRITCDPAVFVGRVIIRLHPLRIILQ